MSCKGPAEYSYPWHAHSRCLQAVHTSGHRAQHMRYGAAPRTSTSPCCPHPERPGLQDHHLARRCLRLRLYLHVLRACIPPADVHCGDGAMRRGRETLRSIILSSSSRGPGKPPGSHDFPESSLLHRPCAYASYLRTRASGNCASRGAHASRSDSMQLWTCSSCRSNVQRRSSPSPIHDRT